MFIYLVVGYKGFGLWLWSMCIVGWEVGEYVLFDCYNKVIEKAICVGVIGKVV